MNRRGRYRIKVSRALALSTVGRYPGTAAVILDGIPDVVIARLTSARLATLIDSDRQFALRSQAYAIQVAIDEGVVWDDGQQRLREIGP